MLNFDHEHPFIHKIRLRFQGKVLRGVKMRKKSIGTILAIFFLSIVFTANTWGAGPATTTTVAASGGYKEAPMLAEMVAKGTGFIICRFLSLLRHHIAIALAVQLVAVSLAFIYLLC